MILEALCVCFFSLCVNILGTKNFQWRCPGTPSFFETLVPPLVVISRSATGKMSSWRSMILRIGEKSPDYGGGAVDFKDHIVSIPSLSLKP